jgi:hypothetical protein
MITGGMVVIKSVFTQKVGKAVDAKGRMMDKAQTKDSSIKVTTLKNRKNEKEKKKFLVH